MLSIANRVICGIKNGFSKKIDALVGKYTSDYIHALYTPWPHVGALEVCGHHTL